MAMFSTRSTGGSFGQGITSSNLVEFKAGKCSLKAGSSLEKRTVHALPSKGVVYIKQTDDMLMHFCWKNRETGTVDDDLIIFPGDIDFVKVKECTSGRVFVLRFKSSDRRLFFWLQEPKTDSDDEYLRKVNDLLNNPPTAGSRTTAAGASQLQEQLSGMGQSLGLGASAEELSALSQLDGNQLSRWLSMMGGSGLDPAALLGAATPASASSNANNQSAITRTPTIPTPSTEPPAARARTSNSNPPSAEPGGSAHIQLADLQSILTQMNLPAGANQEPEVDLSEVLNNTNLRDSVAQNQEQLVQHLPEAEGVNRDQGELNNTVSSPQFRQAVGLFGSALQSGQLGPLMQQFGVSEAAVEAANKGDLESFASQLQQAENAEGGESSTGASKSESSDKSETVTTAVGFDPPKPKRGKHDGDDGDMDLD